MSKISLTDRKGASEKGGMWTLPNQPLNSSTRLWLWKSRGLYVINSVLLTPQAALSGPLALPAGGAHNPGESARFRREG